MNRKELQALSQMRAEEAKCLLAGGHFAGGYYLVGYAVECALKAVIAERQGRFTFPDKAFAAACHTHRLNALMMLSGLMPKLELEAARSSLFSENWSIVKTWNESSRYDVKVDHYAARRMITACLQVPEGVLPWIQTFWSSGL